MLQVTKPSGGRNPTYDFRRAWSLLNAQVLEFGTEHSRKHMHTYVRMVNFNPLSLLSVQIWSLCAAYIRWAGMITA